MECTERLSAPYIPKLCLYDKIKCTNPSVNGSKFCSKHISPPPSHQCTYVVRGQQCKNRIAGSEQRTLCATHTAVKASRKRRRTDAPTHKDLVNKTPPLALHVFRIMTQERQRMNIKPNIYKRPLEHLKWVMKKERLSKNPTYPSGLENECDNHDTPHDYVSLQEPVSIDEESMCDVRGRSVYLAHVAQRIHSRLDSLIHQVDSYRRTQADIGYNTKATIEAARDSVAKTTVLIQGKDPVPGLCPCELPNKASKYTCCMCNNRALPFTKYCTKHILRDNKQLLFGACNTATHTGTLCNAPTTANQPCYLHSVLKKYGVTESQDIETESSSSESDTEDPIFEPSLHSSPSSPKLPPKRLSSPLPPLEPPHLPVEMSMDMLTMQPDTILENSSLPEEPDIPLVVHCLEPPPVQAPIKRPRTKEEEMQARAMYMKYPGGYPGGYYYPQYPQHASSGTPGTPGVFLQGYNKEGEPIYGYHDQKQLEYQRHYTQRQPPTDNGSRPTTPVMNPEMMQQHYYQQQQRFLHHGVSSPNTPPATPNNMVSPQAKKKAPPKKVVKAEQEPPPVHIVPNVEPAKLAANYTPNVMAAQQVSNPYSQKSGSNSPTSAASPSTMAALKFKLSDSVKKEDIPPKPVEEVNKVEKNKAPPKPANKAPKKKTKTTPPKNPMPNTAGGEEPVQHLPPGMPPQHLAMMLNHQLAAQQMPPNYVHYQHPMYANQHPMNPHNQYYLQMCMAQHQLQVAAAAPLVAPPTPQQAEQSNGAASKEVSEPTSQSISTNTQTAATPELNEYQKYALQQQRQRQMMIAQNQMTQYNYPQHYQYYGHPTAQYAAAQHPMPPKVDHKKKKKAPPKEKPKEDNIPKPPQKLAKKPSLSSPTANTKDMQLSSLQSLMSTASSGRLPIDALSDDNMPPNHSISTAIQTDKGRAPTAKPPSRPKKPSAKQDEAQGQGKQSVSERKSPQTTHPSPTTQTPQPPQTPIQQHPNYYQMQSYNPNSVQGPVLMQMAPMKGYYLNGSGGPLYFRVDDTEGAPTAESRHVIFNDAVLARSRPSSVLMKNAGWVERYMSPKKPEQNDKTKANSKAKSGSPRDRRSPQKAPHRNLIFHNTEIGLYSDKLAKQQKNAEQRSHRVACASKVKKVEALPTETEPAAEHPLHQTNQALLQNDTLKYSQQQQAYSETNSNYNHSLDCTQQTNKLANCTSHPDSRTQVQMSSQSDGIT